MDIEKIVRNLPSKPNGTAPDLAWVFCMPFTEENWAGQDCACVIARDWEEIRKECGCDCHRRLKDLSDAIEKELTKEIEALFKTIKIERVPERKK